MNIVIKNWIFLLLVSPGVFFYSCRDPITGPVEPETDVFYQVPATTLQILSLGDSYTIGQSVPVEDRWPEILADSLQAVEYTVDTVRIIARTGWTTSNLLAALDQEDISTDYDLVSLLIGVNNQYRGTGLTSYRSEFSQLLQRAIEYAGDRPQNVFVLSIPDYSETPFADRLDKQKIAAEIDQYNSENRAISEKFGVRYVYITDLTRGIEDRYDELLAYDMLHYSGAMHALWVQRSLPVVQSILEDDVTTIIGSPF
jgi:lysophospholipase L1-like esterase